MACGPTYSAAVSPSSGIFSTPKFLKRSVSKPSVARIGVKTRWAHSPEFIANNLQKFKTRERREQELKEFECRIVLERRTNAVKKTFSPYQIDFLSHPALTVVQNLQLDGSIQRRTEKWSSTPFSLDWRDIGMETPSCPEEENEDSSSSFLDSLGSSFSSYSNLETDPVPSTVIESLPSGGDSLRTTTLSRERSEQYLALMASVSDVNVKPPPAVKPPEKELFVRALDDALKNLTIGLKELEPHVDIADDDFFQACFSVETSLSWVTTEIEELIALPECLLSSKDDVERSKSAAFLRQAAWDHYFFVNSKPGRKFPAPFCKFEEGETPADKFLHPSRAVRDFNAVECFWKPISDLIVLEHFIKFVINGNHMAIPRYLVECGYVDKISRSTNTTPINTTNEKKTIKKLYNFVQRKREMSLSFTQRTLERQFRKSKLNPFANL